MNMMTDVFEAERPRLTSLCYRMLGERAAAEDAVQDTWLKWATVNPDNIENPAAWLRRVATNVALDTLRSARSRREQYVGPWLPEPLIQAEAIEVPQPFELAQECELALLWAMERLTPRERAAFILREVFDATYGEIAGTLATTEAACRQLVSRSQKKLQESGPRFNATPEAVADLTARFFEAVMVDDFDAALSLLTPDTVAISDGGAKRRAARRPLVGGPEILQVFKALQDRARLEGHWTLKPAVVNGRMGLLRLKGGVLDSVTALFPDESGQIGWIYVMVNPDKLSDAT